jgi:ABC-type transport system substrate-binding protein
MMIPEGPLSGGTLTLSASRANTQDIFTPLRAVSSTQGFVFGYVYEPLWIGDTWGMGETPQMTGQWDKALASSWEEVEQDRSYIFNLNPDIWWHDRTRVVDADDILFGMEMAFDPAYNNNKHKTAWGDIEGVKAWAENPTENITDASGVTKIDEMTVQVTIERPDNNWWASGSKVFAMPRHHFAGLNKAIATEARAVDLLGNGPMIFERYVTQQFADLTANKDWAYGAPYVDDYIVRYGDGAALDAATEANEQPNPIDFHRAAGGSRTEAFARLAAQPHLRPFPQRSPFGGHVFFNQTAEIFADMTLEQQSLVIEAMVRAVDRETMNNELYGGTLFISDYIFEHIALLQDPPEGTFRDLSYDPDEARALLEEAQWDSDKVIKWIKWGPPSAADLALKDYWDQVGVKTEFMLVDGSAVIEKLYQERVHDMVLANMGGGQNALDACLRVCSDKVYELGGWNHSNINRPWIDEMYAAVFAANSQEEKREVWLELAARLHAKGSMVAGLLWRGSLLNLYHRRVQGAFWMQHYAIPVRSPINQVWIDPYWEER